MEIIYNETYRERVTKRKRRDDAQTLGDLMKVRKRQMEAKGDREDCKVDTDEEKEQAYSTEITGHSVNLALCSYLRQRIKG